MTVSKESAGVRAFKWLDAARTEIKQYLPDNFDMEQELEEARSERYSSDVSGRENFKILLWAAEIFV